MEIILNILLFHLKYDLFFFIYEDKDVTSEICLNNGNELNQPTCRLGLNSTEHSWDLLEQLRTRPRFS